MKIECTNYDADVIDDINTAIYLRDLHYYYDEDTDKFIDKVGLLPEQYTVLGDVMKIDVSKIGKQQREQITLLKRKKKYQLKHAK